MNQVYTSDLTTAQRAAQAMLGVNPDPRSSGFWNTYLTVDAKAFADLLNALGVPHIGVAEPQPKQPDTSINDWLNMNAGGERS